MVQSSDGETVAIRLSFGKNVKKNVGKIPGSTLNDMQARLRLDSRDALMDCLRNWTPDQLLTHLGRFTAEQLREPARRRFN